MSEDENSVDSTSRRTYKMITKNGRALDVLLSRLLVAAGPKPSAWREDELKTVRSCYALHNRRVLMKPKITLFHNMMEASKESSYWTPIAVVQALLGIWFAASHQPWIVCNAACVLVQTLIQIQNLHFVFLELCSRPEYIELIREEIKEVEDRLDCETVCRLPLLDSFIKESVRLNPLDKSESKPKFLN